MSKFNIAILVLILFCILAFRFSSYYQNQIHYKDGQRITFSSRLTDVPKVNGRLQHFSLVLPRGPKLYITATRFPEYQYGDFLKVSGTIAGREMGEEKKKRTILTMSNPKIAVRKDTHMLYSFASNFRENVTRLYRESLPVTSASLLSGIVFGIKEDMPEEFEQNLRVAGVMHVIAASGMNVAMVGGSIFSFFAYLIHRKRAIPLSILTILLYAVISGLEPSIVRASVMASIALFAAYVGRQYLGILALLLTAYVMLLIKPSYLTDVGFQLSFAATLGIMFVKPPELFLDKKEDKGGTKWWMPLISDIQVTTAAQIATLPILLSVFGEYGLLSVPINALVLWTIPVLMTIGGIAALIGLIMPFLGKLLLLFALPFLWYFETVVTHLGGLGYVIRLPQFPWQFAAMYYAIVIAIIMSRKGHHHSGVLRQAQDKLKRSNLI